MAEHLVAGVDYPRTILESWEWFATDARFPGLLGATSLAGGVCVSEMRCGEVELDETYVGGVSPGNQGRGSTKVGVMVTAEMLGPKHLGRIQLEPSRQESLYLLSFAQRVIEPEALVRTDRARELKRLTKLGYDHKRHVELGSDIPAHVTLYGAYTPSRPCSNDGSKERSIKASATTTSATTSTSSPSASTNAHPTAASCCSTASCSKPQAPSQPRYPPS